MTPYTPTPAQEEEIRKAYLADPDAEWKGAETPELWEQARNETREADYHPYKAIPTTRAEEIGIYVRAYSAAMLNAGVWEENE